MFTNQIPNDFAGQNLKGQIIRSSTSTALNYGEASGSVSIKDAIHKNAIVLKELKESRVAMKIFRYLKSGDQERLKELMQECEQLIAIVATIIKNKQKLL